MDQKGQIPLLQIQVLYSLHTSDIQDLFEIQDFQGIVPHLTEIWF